MSNKKGNKNPMAHRVESVRRTIKRLTEKYLPDVNLLSVAKMTKSEQKEEILRIINVKIAPKRPFLTEKDIEVHVKIRPLIDKINDKNVTSEEKKLLMRQIERLQKDTWNDVKPPLQRFGEEVWIQPSIDYPKIEPKKTSPLNDKDAIMLLKPEERIIVQWLKDLTYSSYLFCNYSDNIKEYFPEIEGAMHIMNPSFMNFVHSTPYRNIAMEYLAASTFYVYRYLPNPTRELKEFYVELESLARRFDTGTMNKELFYMHVVSTVCNAIENFGLREAWRERNIQL